ncbi:uncharacterized protein LOC119686131 [Teleopsis dalmanni]|uniref:uncharacterized protein LOC119686131 n=1 Tax=Teleopsis dalmanni TaxID=139649 RepID=UPI0018CEE8AF|nr:uncharacterized protein LOC119686131 [Teleopsis dalmanni]
MKTFPNIYKIIILLIIQNEINVIQGTRTVEFRSGCSNFSAKYFSNFTLKTVNNTISLDMYIIQPLKSGFKSYFEFQVRLSNSKNYQKLFNYQVDVCNMVASLKESLFKKWFASLRRYGNFVRNCPVPEGHYYINNWSWDSNLIPSFLHSGEYRIKGYGYYGTYKSKNEVMVVDYEVEINIV